MKKVIFILGLIMIIMVSFAWGQSTIYSQGFETDLSGYSHTPSQTPATDPGDQYFYRAEPSDASIYEGSVGPYTNVTGSWLFVGSNPNTINGGNPGVLSFDPINVSGYSNLEFHADFGACDDDWDLADDLKVEYNFDGGSWGTLFYFNAPITNDPLVLTGNAAGGINTANGTVLTYALATISSDNFTGSGSTLNIRIVQDADANYEAFGVDNILVKGTTSGEVLNPTGFSATTENTSQINLAWTENASNNDVLIAWNSTDTFGTPVDGNSYSIGAGIPGGGTSLGTDSDEAYSHTSLDSDTHYYYKIWSVDGSTNYSTGVTADATTYKDEPSNYVTSFTATKDGYSKIDLSWAENDGSVVADGYLIKASTLDNVSNPSDGTPVADNATIGNNSGAKNVTHGTTSYEWAGLDAETTYYFKIFPYTNSGSAINYKTDGTPPSANATTDPMPEIPDLMLSKIADPSDDYNARFVQLYNASGSTIDFSSDTWYICRQSNGSSWGDTQLTGSISIGGIFNIAYSQATFNSTWSFDPDQSSSIINGNGNDGYFLYYDGDHSTGSLVDAYGVIDQDGTGEPWEYTDCKAVRKAGTTEPNTTWTASEWDITSATTSQIDPSTTTLPVILSTFTAQYLNSKPTLYWQTQSELDNMGWFIYRNTIEDFTSAEKISGMLPGHGTTTEPQSYIYEDAEQLQVEQTYYYWLESVDYSGTIHHFDKVAQITIPHPDDPGQNVTPPTAYDISADPNPFSYTTNISFVMDQPSLVDVAIYNIKGELVKSFSSVMTTSENEIVNFHWNGKDNSGKALSNGVYLYSVKVNGKDYATKQLILMK